MWRCFEQDASVNDMRSYDVSKRSLIRCDLAAVVLYCYCQLARAVCTNIRREELFPPVSIDSRYKVTFAVVFISPSHHTGSTLG